jgi:CDP-glucose 4,6-dehydratase
MVEKRQGLALPTGFVSDDNIRCYREHGAEQKGIHSMDNTLRDYRVLVTGASGFTGSWLTEHLLNRGATVTALLLDCIPESYLVSSGAIHCVKKVYGSIENYDVLEKVIGDHGINAVFHLAAVAVQEMAFGSPRQAFEVNIRGTYNILEACRVHSDLIQRVIVASSDKAYGDSDVLPYNEELPIRGKNPYDVSKSCADLIAYSYSHSYGLPIAIGRFGNVYGGGDLNWSRLIPNTIRRLRDKERPLVRVCNNESFRRDFVYVKDIVRAYMTMFKGLARPETHGQAFNFGTGKSWTVEEIVQKIQSYMHLEPVEFLVEHRSHGEILHQQLSAEKAKRELGWTPTYSLDEGVIETINWYQQFFSKRKSSMFETVYSN